MNYKRFEVRTAYNCEKQCKAENYTFLNERYAEKGQIVFAGDSITELFNLHELFYEYIKENSVELYNRGISGDTSNRLIERLKDNVLSLEPKKLVYLIGINDMALGASCGYIAGNVKKIIAATKESCPDCEIAVQSVYPVIDHGLRKNRTVKLLNVLLKEVCRDEKVEFIDVYDLLADENGSFKKDYTYDGLHPNVKGFEVVSKEILKFLNEFKENE